MNKIKVNLQLSITNIFSEILKSYNASAHTVHRKPGTQYILETEEAFRGWLHHVTRSRAELLCACKRREVDILVSQEKILSLGTPHHSWEALKLNERRKITNEFSIFVGAHNSHLEARVVV